MLLGIALPGACYAQDTIHSEGKKVRYLKRLEKKNEHYVKIQEKKTRKLLADLCSKEKKLFSIPDSGRSDSSIRKNSFADMSSELNRDYSLLSEKATKSASPAPGISTIPANLDAGVRNYISRQITTTAYLNDTSCKTCASLKKEDAKARQILAKTEQKLEYLKSVQDKIKKRQDMLQGYFGTMPQYAGRLKEIEKSCFYFNQGMSGFSSMFTNPAAGVENNILKSLAFNKSYASFAAGMKLPPVPGFDAGSLTTPDLKGYQTREQVQALLPQNTAGISPEKKAALISNMQNSLTKFQGLRDKNPSVSALKDKPHFKPNPYRGLPLRQRIVFSKDFQIHARTNYYPVTADLGANLGFKLTERFSPLAGIAFKAGLGQTLQKPEFSNEGITIRSGVDAKLCYGFSLQGLFEETWRTHVVQVNESLSRSPEPAFILALVSKAKLGKKGSSSFMFGYDFLYNRHVPVTSPWVMRIGFQ